MFIVRVKYISQDQEVTYIFDKNPNVTKDENFYKIVGKDGTQMYLSLNQVESIVIEPATATSKQRGSDRLEELRKNG